MKISKEPIIEKVVVQNVYAKEKCNKSLDQVLQNKHA